MSRKNLFFTTLNILKKQAPLFWRQRRWSNYALLPLSALFLIGSQINKWQSYKKKLNTSPNFPIATIVVGNIVVGGGGKTPFVIALSKALLARGWSPGVVSRGYLGRHKSIHCLTAQSQWQDCGDEALLIYQKIGVPVCVGHNRQQACLQLINNYPCNVIISDDGLQHYTMKRDIEIALIKSDYQLGNGWLLPAGPLREREKRLLTCDYCVVIGDGFHPPNSSVILPLFDEFYCLANPKEKYSADFFLHKKTIALAAIANPQAFFDVLKRQSIPISQYVALADHDYYSAEQLTHLSADAIIMTEKDAIKYQSLSQKEKVRLYALSVSYPLPHTLVDNIVNDLHQISKST